MRIVGCKTVATLNTGAASNAVLIEMCNLEHHEGTQATGQAKAEQCCSKSQPKV